MLIRRALALFSAAVIAVSAVNVDAAPFRLHIRAKPSTQDAGGANTVMSVRSTATQRVDLSTALSGCTDAELINATYTGPVKMMLSPAEGFEAGTAGAVRSLRKRELLDYTTADTSSASNANDTSRWSFTCSGGTYQISWNVATPEVNSWNYGADTLERRGGFPLYYLPGNATDWAITTNPSSGFEIWNGRVVLACSGTITQCPTEASNPAYESTTTATRVISAPTGTYNVGLTNSTLGITRTIAITMVAHQKDVAPSSTHLTGSGAYGGQLCDAMSLKDNSLAVAANWGDTIIMEGSKEFPQDYVYSNTAECDGYAVHTTRAGGPAKPSLPYDAGWITVTSREPWQARLATLTTDVRGMLCAECGTHHDWGIRYSALDTYTHSGDAGVNGLRWRDFGVGSHYFSLAQNDHMKAGTIDLSSRASDGQWKLFATHNYVDPTLICNRDADGNGVAIMAYDGKLIGNFITNSCHDAIDQALVNSNPADPQAEVTFNVAVNVHYLWGGSHNDFLQSFYNTVPWLNLSSQIGDMSGPRVIGNLLVHGSNQIDAGMVARSGGSLVSGDIGKENIDGEGFLDADIGGFGEKRIVSKAAGNLIIGTFTNGILRGWSGNGSVTTHNTLVYPQYVVSGAGRTFIFGTGDPALRGNGIGAIETMTYNAQSGASTAFQGSSFGARAGTGATSFTASAPITTGNQLGLSSNWTGNFKDPFNVDYSSKRAIIDHWTPKSGSAFETSTAGFIWDITKVDIRGQTYDPSFLVRDGSLIDTPVCTAAGTITAGWSGTGVAGNVATVTADGTFNTTGTDTHNWLVLASGDTKGYEVVSSTGGSYTLTSADLARPGTHTLIHLVGRTNAGGGGQCSSNALTF